jgi:hypothetical protein
VDNTIPSRQPTTVLCAHDTVGARLTQLEGSLSRVGVHPGIDLRVTDQKDDLEHGMADRFLIERFRQKRFRQRAKPTRNETTKLFINNDVTSLRTRIASTDNNRPQLQPIPTTRSTNNNRPQLQQEPATTAIKTMVVILTADGMMRIGLEMCGFDGRRQNRALNLRRFKAHFGSNTFSR